MEQINIWIRVLLVAGAGGLGAVCRYFTEGWLKHFPMGFGTWVINSLGCFLIGVFAGWLANAECGWNQDTRTTFSLLTMTGFCGGFSTFSTYTLESVKYYESGHFLTWVVFGAMTLFVGLFGCGIGYYIGKHL